MSRKKPYQDAWKGVMDLPHYDRLRLAVLCLISIGSPVDKIVEATDIASSHLDELGSFYVEVRHDTSANNRGNDTADSNP